MRVTTEVTNATNYEELIETVSDVLPSTNSVKEKKELAQYIAESLVSMGKLLKQTNPSGEVCTFIVLPDNRIVELNDRTQDVLGILYQMGIFGAELIAKYVTAAIQHRARFYGTEVKVARFSHYANGKLYVSSGPRKMNVASYEKGVAHCSSQPNGYDDVLFLADSCFPEWQITDDALAPSSIAALNPNFEEPDEVKSYLPEHQQTLATAWMVSVLSCRRPMPVLVAVGQKGSGKSTYARAITKLFCGDNEDITPAPDKAKDFATCASSLNVYAIDNLDTAPADWFYDLLAIASTGGTFKGRKLFEDATRFDAQFISSVLITTRTAEFAGRADIRERCVPLFFAEREGYSDENVLLAEVIAKRSSVLTYLMKLAIQPLHQYQGQQGLNRFVAFTNVVRSLNEQQYECIVMYLEKAQRLSISEGDQLLNAILRYNTELEGTPSNMVKTLEDCGYDLKMYGGGKGIAKALREIRKDLELAGFTFSAKSWGHTTMFKIIPPS